VIISTNAGMKTTPAWSWRREAMNSPRWKCHVWSKTSPWVDPEDVEEARRRDPIGKEFDRLWRGMWSSGMGDAVKDEDIERAFRADGPMTGKERGWVFIAGLDLGVKKDHAGIAVVGVKPDDARLRVAWLSGIEPSLRIRIDKRGSRTDPDNHDMEVPIAEVKAACRSVDRTYRPSWFFYDPAAGGSFLAQELRDDGLPMEEAKFGSTAFQTQMAQTLVQVMKAGILECYEDEEGRLRRDLGKFSIVPKKLGPDRDSYKLEAVSDEHGHADVGIALAMCLPKAVEMLGGWSGIEVPDEDEEEHDPWREREPLTEEEEEAMDEDLKVLYDFYGEDEGRWYNEDQRRFKRGRMR